MSETILLQREGKLSHIPRDAWEKHLAHIPDHGRDRLSFMSENHHRVRYFIVEELPRFGAPMPPQYISTTMNLPLSRVVEILDELEKNLFFLFRNSQGAVTWAYPVTVEKTPHRLTFDSGESLYAA